MNGNQNDLISCTEVENVKVGYLIKMASGRQIEIDDISIVGLQTAWPLVSIRYRYQADRAWPNDEYETVQLKDFYTHINSRD